MILKIAFGSSTTCDGRAPVGASQWLSDCPLDELSSQTRFKVFGGSNRSSASAVALSRKNTLALQSWVMDRMLFGVADGEIGATAMAARSAPRNTAQYSIDVVAHMATMSPA